MSDLYIGLMSGTSMDGVDGVLADFSNGAIRVLADASAPFPPDLRTTFMALNRSGPDELHRAALAGNELAGLYGQVVQALLTSSGCEARQVRAIGAHGQTVRHQPQAHGGTGYTLQINNPALLAEMSGIAVVADFRSRDVAAGGQGAPLAPFFHRAVFGRRDETVGILNLGGIANLTVLRPDGSQLGFDCGPANALMDLWCEQHNGHPFDRDGAWAASGTPSVALLEKMLAHTYFVQPPPKSTGRDLFHAHWLTDHLAAFDPLPPADVQATLAELTARSCADAVLTHGRSIGELLVCGGGAFNGHLMRRLQSLLPFMAVKPSSERGLPPMQVEAAAFAWLARKTVLQEPLDLPKTTGARGARVLGAIWPA